MEDVKGTAMSIASLFPVEEAEKAVTRVQEVIAEKQKELHQLDLFISDNNNLLKLVQRLPDELSHDVMVPFGKAAFFPGRLIHTIEFLVLLGEGYYTERTSKQTIDILNRRGRLLDAKMDSGKAVLVDLKAEASFFDNTANEAAEGLVDIREDYTEKNPAERMSYLGDSSQLDLLGDPEEAEAANDGDEEYADIMARLDEFEREELAAEGVLESDDYEDTKIEICSSRSRDYFDMVSKNSAVPVNKDSEPSSKTRPNSSTAFTGSKVEHTHGLQTSPLGKISTSSQSTESAPSKPVSRFMMQKGGH